VYVSIAPDGLCDVHKSTRMGDDETAMFSTERRDRRVRRQAGLLLESLDDRRLLSGGARGAVAEALVISQSATDAHSISPREVLLDRSPAALPADVSAPLRSLYHEFKDQVRDSGSTGNGLLAIRDTRVAVRIKVAFPPALGAYVSELRADGMQILRTVPADGMAEGTVPIAKLPAVAKLAAHVWPATLPIKR